MTRHRRLPITRSSRGDQQRPQLPIHVEIAQVRPDQMKRLSLPRRQSLASALLAPRRTRKRRALRNNTKQRKAIDSLQILRLPDPPVKTLQQKSDPQAEEQAKHSPKDRVPGDLRRGRSRRHRRSLRNLDIAVTQFGKRPQRLRAILQREPRSANSFLRGERLQLLFDKLQGGGVVGVVAVLLLCDELLGVGIRDTGRERWGAGGGFDVHDVRFPLRAHAQVFADLFLGQPLPEQTRGLGRHIAELDELQIGVLLGPGARLSSKPGARWAPSETLGSGA